MTPVMLGAAASALLENPVWGYLVWGLPSAVVLATLWTQFWLMRTPAELHLRPGQAAVQSVHDVLYNRPLSWHSLHNVRAGRWEVELSVGWRTYTLRPADWSEYDRIRSAAKGTFQSTQAPRATGPAS